MTTKIGSLAVSLSLDASNFNGSMAQVDRNLRTMSSELKATKALGADYGKSLDGLRSKKDILSRSVEASTVKLMEERKKYDELVASGKANEAQLERQAKKVNDAQVNYNRLTTELGEVEKALKIQSSSWTQYGEKMEAAGSKMKSIGQGMTNVGDSLTKNVTLPLAGLGAGAFKAAVDFESAFAGVRKTVDGTEAEFAMLSSGIRDMAKEIPAAATEIAGVAEAAGQLGIKKEAILGFTRTMTDLGVATNMTSEEAATALARLANITQMNQQDFDKLGSSVVALGNNFATTEKEIVDMALRLAGAGAQVGMSEADILALSAALSSVGIEAEMGGSAISRVMVNMQVATSTGFSKVQELSKKTGLSIRDMQMMASHSGKAFGNLAEDLGMTKKELTNLVNAGVDLEGFSKVAGMTGEQFKQAFEKDAIGALGAFINGLANAEESGESAINMLQEMGITEIRLRDSLLRAGGAAELFANSVELSNDAWDENNALTKEAEERYKTTASQMKILWNRITDIGISFGEILIPMAQEGMDKIGGLVDKFASLDKEQQKNIIKMVGLAAAAGPVLSMTGRMSTSFGNLLLIGGSLAKGIGGAGGLAASLGAVAGPGAIAVGALAAVAAGGYGLYKVLNETSIPEIDIFGDTVSDNTKKAVGAFTKLTDEASVQLDLLKVIGTKVSEEMAGSMVETFKRMGDTILSDMKEDHAAQLEAARTHLAATVSLSEEEQGKLLSVIVDGQTEREAKVESAQKQYNEIIERASNERRGFTEYEKSELDRLQSEMKETGIKYLSETEAEALVILERLKIESGKINAEQALETAKRARESKEAVIEEAEKKYDETIKWAQFLKEDGSKESLALYENIVKDAENTRDETIKAAEGRYDEIIRISKEKGDEYLTELELRLGREMTAWEKLSVDVGKETMTMGAKVVGAIRQMATDGGLGFAELRRNGLTSATELARGYDIAVNKIPGVVRNMLIDAVAEVTKSVTNFYNAGMDAGQGIIDGLKSKTKDVAVEASKMGINMLKSFDLSIGRKSPAKEFIKSAKDAGNGLVVGLRDSISVVTAASMNLGKSMMNAVSKILIDGTKKVNSEVAAIEKQAAVERAKIQQRSAEDISVIRAKAAKSKQGLTQSDALRIQRIEEDSADKIKKLNEKTAKDIEKLQSDSNKKRLDELKQFVADKKQSEEMSLIDEVNFWRRSVTTFADGTKEKMDAQKSYRNAVEAVNKEIESINRDHTDAMNRIIDDSNKKVQEQTDLYNNAFSSRVAAIKNFAGLFDEFVVTMDKSGQDLIKNMQSQVLGLAEWRGQLEALWKRVDDQALMEELEALGPKALGELRALNSLSDTELSQYVALYNAKFSLARDQASSELAGMKEDTERRITELRVAANRKLSELQTDWTNKIKSVTKATNDEFKTLTGIGKKAGQNLLDGLASMEGELVNKARAIATAVNSALQGALGGSVSIPNMPVGGKSSSTSSNPNVTHNYTGFMDGATFVVREEADIQKIARELHVLQKQAARGVF